MTIRRKSRLGGWLAMLGAAAVIAIGCTGGNSSDVVALVPHSEWLDTARVAEAATLEMGDEAREHPDTAVVAPADAPDQFDRMVYVELANWAESEPEGEPVSAGELSGVYTSHVEHRQWAMLQLGDGDLTLSLRAIEGTDRGTLDDLAATIDIARPLDEQEWGPNWTLVTTRRALDGYDTHLLAATAPGGASIQVSTARVPDESVIHMRHDVFLSSPIEVRGRPGAVLRYDPDSHLTSLSWIEAPGIAVSLMVNSGEPDPLAHALTVAEQLVAIDDEAWQELVARNPSSP